MGVIKRFETMRDVTNEDQWLGEEISNYFDCSDKKLQEESILAVLNYIYDLGKRGK